MARGAHMPTTSKENSFNVTKDRVQRTLTKTMANSKVMADKTSHLLVSFLSTILTGVLVLAVSVFLYGTFYYAYMPVEMHHLPVHLQFTPCPDSTLRCSFPSAQLNLKRNQKLLQGQTYSISLKLDIPDSPVNEDHGMFMSCVKISSTSGEQIGESCKSSISEYRSSLPEDHGDHLLQPGPPHGVLGPEAGAAHQLLLQLPDPTPTTPPLRLVQRRRIHLKTSSRLVRRPRLEILC
eukprot:TRINITY_DN3507_c0_g1_i11.p1 TRINITY_DN3507_c0_g1~~TRINITY_DN3507_c0_g1_i11.p1  ORF type:complete len:236 (-),score=57.56 TRINITY_DN3507_c0_g1_i11:207-914(-)